MIAFVFPGQGAQLPGMGRQILQEDPAAQALARAASDRLGIDLLRLCVNATTANDCGPACAMELST